MRTIAAVEPLTKAQQSARQPFHIKQVSVWCGLD